ncbi:MAG: acetyltransferase [Cohaesibacteraceae bacterium]|nr:acetyltransferase [Cohaesibacteraceae bacterium]
MPKPLVIFGSSETAELAKFYFENDSDYQVVAFTVDDKFVETDQFMGLPVVAFSHVNKEFPPKNHEMHIALSYTKLNKLRHEKYVQAKEAGYQLASYVCSKSITWPDLSIGDNCFILENQTIQPTVKIGNNVMIWSGNHIGHGSVIGNHSYIASHVVISGNCSIGERCFIGVNATLKDFTEIGDDCFIAMDASVTKNMPNGAVSLGTPAEVFTKDNRRARALKRTYFKV